MSKEINVKKELWDKAHELEKKAMDNSDLQAMNEAAEWKSKLCMVILQESGGNPAPVPEGFKTGKGVPGCLDNVGVIEEVTKNAEE